jgi:adenylosuccinate synthase
MRAGKFNVVTDGMWGSCGKGLIATFLAWRHRPRHVSTTNMPNAGHTGVYRLKSGDDVTFISKVIPTSGMFNSISEVAYLPDIWLGASSAFTTEQLNKELEACGYTRSPNAVHIHPRAGVVTQEHKEREAGGGSDSTKHIASTMQGGGAFLSDKVLRKKDLKLARDFPEISKYVYGDYMPTAIEALLDEGVMWMHEGSQGFSLDMNHGSHYPQCTSRSTSAVQNLADMGLGAKHMGDVYVVIRPYPIRVGNVVEGGSQVGYSGDCYQDQREMTWAEVAKEAGAPEAVMKGELTTVTKRLRRVFSFSMEQVKMAITVNGATHIALNFANYIDWSCYGKSGGIEEYNALSDKIKKFVDNLEEHTGIPVALIGTGPRVDNVIDRRRGTAKVV